MNMFSFYLSETYRGYRYIITDRAIALYSLMGVNYNLLTNTKFPKHISFLAMQGVKFIGNVYLKSSTPN